MIPYKRGVLDTYKRKLDDEKITWVQNYLFMVCILFSMVFIEVNSDYIYMIALL